MSFVADYLNMNVKPLYGKGDMDEKGANNRGGMNNGNVHRVNACLQRFRNVLPEDTWVAGDEIARRLQTTPASSNKSLQKFRAQGLVESRKIREGVRALEWRWIP